MKTLNKRSLAWLCSLLMLVSIFASVVVLPAQAATVDYVTNGKYVYNWGTRETVATFLSPMAEEWYEKNNVSYEDLAALKGSSTQSSVPSSPLYLELKDLMTSNHKTITSYNDTRSLYQYTDCQNSGKTSKKISSFYSGKEIGPAWDGGDTWNREHTWPNSKGLAGSDENDIMMLRPTSKSENSSRGNTAYGKSGGYYNPNSESGGKYDLRGDVARIMLYVYCRWGNTGKMWGSAGVMESRAVLLEWMEADPVDTWELGRNDSVQSITGTRNVFVDYPELVFILFGEEIPEEYTSPSGKGGVAAYTVTATSNNTAYGTVAVNGKTITATPKAGYSVEGYTILSGSATVAQNGNIFTVTTTGDVSIRINFVPRAQVQVQFAQGDSIVATETAYSGDAITLPAHSGAVSEGVNFVGWVAEALAETTDIPVFYAAGAKYTVDKNVTLHALYSRTEEDGGTNNNLFVPHVGPLVEGDYLIVYDGQAMTGSVNDKTRLDAVAVTMQGGSALLPANNAVWHIAPDGDYWTIYNLETGKYAAGTSVKSSNQATTIASLTDYAKWTLTIKSTGYEFTNVGRVALSANPLLRYNPSVSAFACYATSTTAGGPNKLYKRASGTTYYFTGEAPAACEHEYDDEYDADCNLCGETREVPEKPAVILGDLNGDGSLNNRDLGLMQKYLNDWDVVVATAALDITQDGKVNNRDLAALQRLLNA